MLLLLAKSQRVHKATRGESGAKSKFEMHRSFSLHENCHRPVYLAAQWVTTAYYGLVDLHMRYLFSSSASDSKSSIRSQQVWVLLRSPDLQTIMFFLCPYIAFLYAFQHRLSSYKENTIHLGISAPCFWSDLMSAL